MIEEIKSEIKSVLFKTVGREFAIDDSADLANLPEVDSLLILQFIVALEKQFGVNFQDGNIEEILKNINSLALYLENKKNG